MTSRLAVVSPHLDDAVFSLGATIAAAVRRNEEVRVITVLAGDPDSVEPASEWDRLSGFRSAGEASRARRAEDAAACTVLGATAVWLPGAEGTSDDELVAQLRPALESADLVLSPGFPCSHRDHLRVAQLTFQATRSAVGLYVEQPYATWRLLGSQRKRGARIRNAVALARRARRSRVLQEPCVPGGLKPFVRAPVRWHAAEARASDWRRKRRALRCYRSQLHVFDRFTIPGVGLYEWAWGGECVGQVEHAGAEEISFGSPSEGRA